MTLCCLVLVAVHCPGDYQTDSQALHVKAVKQKVLGCREDAGLHNNRKLQVHQPMLGTDSLRPDLLELQHEVTLSMLRCEPSW